MTTKDYIDGTYETNRPRELAHGMVREPPSPFYGHQHIVLRIARLLSDHIEPRGLGRVGIAPLDVVLDAENALILQPDVLFVAEGRASIIRNQIWGAPDLVVEVFSPGTEEWDTRDKVVWYRQYGVREYWLVNPKREAVVVLDFGVSPPVRRLASGARPIESTVLPDFHVSASFIFA
jgi:Uma2 family endonuclease